MAVVEFGHDTCGVGDYAAEMSVHLHDRQLVNTVGDSIPDRNPKLSSLFAHTGTLTEGNLPEDQGTKGPGDQGDRKKKREQKKKGVKKYALLLESLNPKPYTSLKGG